MSPPWALSTQPTGREPRKARRLAEIDAAVGTLLELRAEIARG